MTEPTMDPLVQAALAGHRDRELDRLADLTRIAAELEVVKATAAAFDGTELGQTIVKAIELTATQAERVTKYADQQAATVLAAAKTLSLKTGEVPGVSTDWRDLLAEARVMA